MLAMMQHVPQWIIIKHGSVYYSFIKNLSSNKQKNISFKRYIFQLWQISFWKNNLMQVSLKVVGGPRSYHIMALALKIVFLSDRAKIWPS